MRRRFDKSKRPERDPREFGARCDECALRSNPPPVFGYGPTGARLAIIGEAPGNHERETGTPFCGKSGDYLDRYLDSVGLSRAAIYIDNAMLCMPPGGDFKQYERIAKREAKTAGVTYVSPIICCQTRLFQALGVSVCKKCKRWKLGASGARCGCEKPKWAPTGERKIEVIVPVGNAALLSLLGLDGIGKWRGSPLEI